ncbi:MAG: hypothetical protein NVSMB52_05650 [Chloroflexota bacterium]
MEEGRGDDWRTWSTQSCSGSTGTTRGISTVPAATSRQRNLKTFPTVESTRQQQRKNQPGETPPDSGRLIIDDQTQCAKMVAAKKQELLDELRTVFPNTLQPQAVFERVREELSPDHLATIREAASLLCIRSINTLKALLLTAQVPTVKIGTYTRIARRELDLLQRDCRPRALQNGQTMWDQVDDAFGIEGLTQEEMDGLSESCPGNLPPQRA